MKAKYLFILAGMTALCGASQTQGVVRATMVQVIVQADVNQVRFDEMYRFEATAADSNEDITIQLPKDALNISSGDSAGIMLNAEAGQITKHVTKESNEVSVSFILANRDGMCATSLRLPTAIDRIAVFLGGKAMKMESPVLKFDKAMAEYTAHPAVYGAENVPKDTDVAMAISGLPRRFDERPYTLTALGGLVIIAVSGGFLLLRKKKQ